MVSEEKFDNEQLWKICEEKNEERYIKETIIQTKKSKVKKTRISVWILERVNRINNLKKHREEERI